MSWSQILKQVLAQLHAHMNGDRDVAVLVPGPASLVLPDRIRKEVVGTIATLNEGKGVPEVFEEVMACLSGILGP